MNEIIIQHDKVTRMMIVLRPLVTVIFYSSCIVEYHPSLNKNLELRMLMKEYGVKTTIYNHRDKLQRTPFVMSVRNRSVFVME